MRKYLATLHEKPDHHKKRFAFLVSGSFTLILFIGWAVVRFGTPGLPISAPKVETTARTGEVTPLETLTASVRDGWGSITSQFRDMKKDAESINVSGKYQEIRSDALNSYGQ